MELHIVFTATVLFILTLTCRSELRNGSEPSNYTNDSATPYPNANDSSSINATNVQEQENCSNVSGCDSLNTSRINNTNLSGPIQNTSSSSCRGCTQDKKERNLNCTDAGSISGTTNKSMENCSDPSASDSLNTSHVNKTDLNGPAKNKERKKNQAKCPKPTASSSWNTSHYNNTDFNVPTQITPLSSCRSGSQSKQENCTNSGRGSQTTEKCMEPEIFLESNLTGYHNLSLVWIVQYNCTANYSLEATGLLIQSYAEQCPNQICVSYEKKENRTEVLFECLTPSSFYELTFDATFSFQSSQQKIVSKKISLNTTEKVTAEGPVNLTVNTTNGVVIWNHVPYCYGGLLGYELTLFGERIYNTSFNEKQHISSLSNETKYQLQPLKNGTNYTLQICGRTLLGLEKCSNMSFETNISEPESPLIHGFPSYNISSGTALVYWSPVSDINGPIISYQIIIKDMTHSKEIDLTAICMEKELPVFNTSRHNEFYIAAEISAESMTDYCQFVIGDATMHLLYHNAQLRSGRNYSVIVRAISSWRTVTKYSCSVSGPFYAFSEAPEDKKLFWKLSMVYLLVIIPFMIIAVFIICKISKRRHSKMDEEGTITLSEKGSAIPVKDLLAHIINMKKMWYEERNNYGDDNEDNDGDSAWVAKEYTEIPIKYSFPCSVAVKEANSKKNRYAKIVPYDYSRVILHQPPGKEENDYINASYIQGFNKSRCYIATQGPLESTIEDFWSMVWQENSEMIIMLTNLTENQTVKCAKYWPDTSDNYGDFTITLLKTEKTSEVITRTFEMTKEGSCLRRTITHSLYTAWPDHGVPKTASGLRHIVHKIHTIVNPKSGPIIVHCSAGIGRTGTLIALDYLLMMAKDEKRVDVVQCVSKMREQRMNMVQTLDQYMFIYDSLIEFLECGDTNIKIQDVHNKVKSMEKCHPQTGKNGFQQEFKVLDRISDLYRLQPCRNAQKDSNRHKNRNTDILPGDEVLTPLMSVTNKDGSPGYINAVFVNCYQKEDGFILTQVPLEETVADFWALVYDYRCTAIVLMQTNTSIKKNSSMFWPQTGECSYSLFHIKNAGAQPSTGYTITKLELSKSAQSDKQHVSIIQLEDWTETEELPQSCSTIISMAQEVISCQENHNSGPTIIVCWDGCSRSGIFCVTSFLTKQMKEESRLDVFQAVKSLRIHRPQLIKNEQQYRFCYKMATALSDFYGPWE
ncbi:PTPRM phosphatase, partial [Polypterus senegalus]|nr:receptor-type tyrosine-protein phosphatase alpha-like [Polypterus senegalus]MBN3294185.1 PTPRM phosphatase [Polypterus senegalus]